jgi:hypothetical protein
MQNLNDERPMSGFMSEKLYIVINISVAMELIQVPTYDGTSI